MATTRTAIRSRPPVRWPAIAFGVLLLAFLAGCRAPTSRDFLPLVDSSASPALDWAEARALEPEAETETEVRAILEAYRAVPATAPHYAEARTAAARLCLLWGALFAENTDAQRAAYELTRELAADALRPELRQFLETPDPSGFARVDGPPTATEMEALFIWSNAVFYTFRDVASWWERVFRHAALRHAEAVLRAMEHDAPDWGEGSLQFALGIYYLAIPDVLGGDRALAARLMDEAVARSDRRLLTRWGRAKYLATALGDEALFRRDLEWVLAQDPAAMTGPSIWNRYFQTDARRMLEAQSASKAP